MNEDSGNSLLILGRQPALGLAELESLYGADKLKPFGANAAIVKLPPESIEFRRLGGSLKLAEILEVLETTDWSRIIKFLTEFAPELAGKIPDGKIRLGISAYGFKTSPAKINAGGLSIKKTLTKSGRSVRLVPNKSSELNAASIIHNKLTGQNGLEFLLASDGKKTVVARTFEVQDINSYTERDRSRPKRDARVGMLPPKLAQIIINLATAGKPPTDAPLLDPFCGTGVILQEALLMGYSVYGSDNETRMVDYSRNNLDWLRKNDIINDTIYDIILIEPGDATNHEWNSKIGLVASETYLGRPFTSQPSSEILSKTVSECNLIIKKFLQNIYSQIEPGTRLCLAVPAWQISPGKFKYLPLVDQLRDLGYNQVRFERVSDKDLLYFREDQIVARQLLVLIRK